jgi:hypothetical protein
MTESIGENTSQIMARISNKLKEDEARKAKISFRVE